MMSIMVISALILCSLCAWIVYRFSRLVEREANLMFLVHCVNLKVFGTRSGMKLKDKLMTRYKTEFNNLFDISPPDCAKLSNFGLKFVSYMASQGELKFSESYRHVLERRLGFRRGVPVSKSELLIECDLRKVNYKRCHDLLCKMEFIYI